MRDGRIMITVNFVWCVSLSLGGVRGDNDAPPLPRKRYEGWRGWTGLSSGLTCICLFVFCIRFLESSRQLPQGARQAEMMFGFCGGSRSPPRQAAENTPFLSYS